MTVEPWDMMADNTIWAMLTDPNHPLDNQHVRLMFIELFRRLKGLEQENYALKILLFEHDILDEQEFNKAVARVKEFFQKWDASKEKEMNSFATSGVSFMEWANFTKEGKFDPKQNI